MGSVNNSALLCTFYQQIKIDQADSRGKFTKHKYLPVIWRYFPLRSSCCASVIAQIQFRCPDFSCQELGTRSALPATCTAECCSRCEFFTCILAGSMGGSDWMGGPHGWKVPWFAPQKYERWYLYSLKGLVTSNDFFFGGNDSSGRLDLHFAKRFTEMDVQHNLLAPGNGSTDSWHQKGGKVVGMCLVWKILASIIFCSQADQSSCEDNIHIYIYICSSPEQISRCLPQMLMFLYTVKTATFIWRHVDLFHPDIYTV